MHVVGVPEFALQSTEHEHEPEELDASVAAVLASGDRDEIFGGGHHRHEPREAHASHTLRSKKIAAVVLLKNEGQEQVGEGPGVPAHHHHHHHGHGHADIENWAGDEEGDGDVTGEGEADGLLHHGHDHAHAHDGHLGHREQVTIGRRRQVVGILVSLLYLRMKDGFLTTCRIRVDVANRHHATLTCHRTHTCDHDGS